MKIFIKSLIKFNISKIIQSKIFNFINFFIYLFHTLKIF